MIARSFIPILLCSLLGGCDAGRSIDPETGTADGVIVRGVLNHLERSGTLPVLDRSDGIAGPDINADGVRDDIEQWIMRQGWADAQARAALQSARSMQAVLMVDLTRKDHLQRVSEAHWEALVCLERHFESMERTHALDAKLEAMTMNTYPRSKRYALYNRARHGSVTLAPQGDTCLT